MRVSKKALEVTNPGAEYIVLTDYETASRIDKEFDVRVVAPGGPLMISYIVAQAEFCKQTKDGMTLLADTDAVANRSLDTALHREHGVAVTYRMRGVSKINNVAYVQDHERAAWYLDRSLGFMEKNLEHWFGDQQAWEDALGPFDTWEPITDDPEGIRVARPEGKEIYLYPCLTHNYFRKVTGTTKKLLMPEDPYLVHFKGEARKRLMVPMVTWCILEGKTRGRGMIKCVSHLLDTQDTGEQSSPEPSESADTT